MFMANAARKATTRLNKRIQLPISPEKRVHGKSGEKSTTLFSLIAHSVVLFLTNYYCDFRK